MAGGSYTASMVNTGGARTGMRDRYVGVISASSVLSHTATGTASSIWFLAKIPHGATILDYMFFVNDASTTNQVWKLGVQYPLSGSICHTESALAATGFSSTDAITHRGDQSRLPYRVSLTTNVDQRYAWITAVNVVDICDDAVIRFTVFYTMDDDDVTPHNIA